MHGYPLLFNRKVQMHQRFGSNLTQIRGVNILAPSPIKIFTHVSMKRVFICTYVALNKRAPKKRSSHIPVYLPYHM